MVSQIRNKFSDLFIGAQRLFSSGSSLIFNNKRILVEGEVSSTGDLIGASGVLQTQINNIGSPANPYNLVYTTGIQTIGGNKTFSNAIVAPGLSYQDVSTISFSENEFLIDYVSGSQEGTIDVKRRLLRSSPFISSGIRIDWANQLLIRENQSLSVDWGNSYLSGEWYSNATGVINQTVINYERLTGVSGILQRQIISGLSGVGVSSINTLAGALTLNAINGLAVFSGPGTTITLSGSGRYINQLTDIPSGVGVQRFGFSGTDFATAPNVFVQLLNNSGDPILSHYVSGINTSGFGLVLSNATITNNYKAMIYSIV